MLLTFHVSAFLVSSVSIVIAVSNIREFGFEFIPVCAGNYGTVFEQHGSIRSSIGCATVCSNSPYCASSLYDLGTKSCSLNMEEWLNYQTTGCSLAMEYFERYSCTLPYKSMRLCEGGGPGVCDTSKGRIEILHSDSWHLVCDDFWGDEPRPADESFADANSNAMCRMLGYTSGTSNPRSHFGVGTGSYLLDNVSCQGNETSLLDCPANALGSNNCVPNEDVGVSCL